MRFRTLLLLTVTVLLLGVFIWYVEMGGRGWSSGSRDEGTVLHLAADQTSYLLIERDGFLVELDRNEDGWRMTRPYAARADGGVVDRILTSLEEMPEQDVVTAQERQDRGLKLEDFGLLKPQGRFVVGDPEFRETLLIGNCAPWGTALYCRIEGREEIICTYTNLLAVVPALVEDLRDRVLVEGTVPQAKRLEIKRADGFIQLVRNEGTWVIQSPVVANADRGEVWKLLTTLFNLRAERFVPVATSPEVEEDEAVAQIGVWTERDDVGKRILVGRVAAENAEEMYVKCVSVGGDESICTVRKEAILPLLETRVPDLRDRALFGLVPADVGAVRITKGDRRLEMLRGRDGTWSIAQPGQWPAEDAFVRNAVQSMLSYRIQVFVDPVETDLSLYGLSPPAYAVAMAATAEDLANEKNVKTLALGSATPDRWKIYARMTSDQCVFEVHAGLLRYVSVDPFTYRDRSILTLAPESVTSIRIARAGREQTVERDALTGAWQGERPEAVVRTNAVTAILGLVRDLQAAKFESVPLSSFADLGLEGDGRMAITFGLQGQSSIRKTLLIGIGAELGYHATVRGQDVVFVLDKSIVDKLEQDLIQ